MAKVWFLNFLGQTKKQIRILLPQVKELEIVF